MPRPRSAPVTAAPATAAAMTIASAARAPAAHAAAALAAAALAAGCGSPPACEATLFGVPGARTGLTADQCGPTCACDGTTWTAPTYGADDLAALRALVLLEPPAPLTEDPYAAPPPPPPDGAYCAVVREAANGYRLQTFAARADAEEAGATPTHAGACGLCSTLEDLAVYIETPDLTEPVRACGLMYPSGPAADHLQCLRDLGFTEPCAQIWYYNTVNTRAACFAPCLLALEAPYHLPDGSLNECLQCDEDQSGPVFKAVAGRTRRNTGVPSAMCRPCAEVDRLLHRY
ncbi:MAG: hypothetical protein KJZ91_01655 [Myxococcales bacterium]|nr:hypothetical protein [Myxococcales bacterium]